MPNHWTEVGRMQMEAARSSRSSSYDEIEYDAKMHDVNRMDTTVTSSDFQGSPKGDSTSAQHHQADSRPEETLELKHCGAVPGRAEEVMAMELSRKIYESGLGDVKAQEMHGMSGCSNCEETESDNDDDLSSTWSDDCEEFSFNPGASGVMPSVLPDIQLRVPMEDENDVQRVKNALLIKGVLEVACDEERQIVTVTGTVHPARLLQKVRKVKRQAQVISTVSPFAAFINPHFRPSTAFADPQEATDHVPQSSSTAIDIPSPQPVPNFVVHQQRPRPTFQRYTFHNDAHSPYLRTFSPSDLSPANSPALVTGDAFDDRRRDIGFPFLDDDLFQDIGVM